MISTRFARHIALATTFTAAALMSTAPASAETTAQEKSLTLTTVNDYRAKYQARPLTWSDELTPATEQHAKDCKFKHSNASNGYGETLHAETATDNQTAIKSAFRTWMAESARYNYGNPGFSLPTGNFTQVVWQSTTQISLAVAQCPAGSILPEASTYVVARYTPAGNQLHKFHYNVGRPR